MYKTLRSKRSQRTDSIEIVRDSEATRLAQLLLQRCVMSNPKTPSTSQRESTPETSERQPLELLRERVRRLNKVGSGIRTGRPPGAPCGDHSVVGC